MHDLDELRRRLWLAMMVGAVGCDAGDAKPTEAANVVAHIDDETGAKPDVGSANLGAAVRKPGGMSSVVNGAVATAEATTKAKKEIAAAKKEIAAAKKAALAASTCEVVVDRRKAASGAAGKPTTDHDCPARSDGLRLDVGATGLLRDSGDDDNCCYQEVRRPVRGRPYTVNGAPQLPEFGVRPRVSSSTLRAGSRRRIAAGWLHDAREELASVAAFERAALELAAAGAPRSLIDPCGVAAAQEQHHAALCLAIAEEFAERPLRLGSPPPVKARRLSLLALLTETFEAGCAGETIAAAIAKQSARGASDPIRLALLEIADDETEHAALAWRTLAWGLPRLNNQERAEFFASATTLRVAEPAASVRPHAPLPTHGRLTPTSQTRVAAEVWAHIISPLLLTLDRALAEQRNGVQER